MTNISPEKIYQDRRQEVNSRPETEPSVTIYNLSTNVGRSSFYDSLRELPKKLHLEPWSKENNEDIMLEALDRGIITDQMPLQLMDLLVARRPAGSLEGRQKAVDRYGQMYSLPQNGVYVEYNFESNVSRYVHTLSPDNLYEIMFSRNQHAISPEVQQILRKNKYAMAGASVGGMVAWEFLMSGAENINIVDGGVLKPHSFNRVSFAQLKALGENKANFFKKQALKFNPFVNIESLPTNLTKPDQMSNFVKGASALIEAVDSIQNKEDIQRSGINANTTVYAPTDLGLGRALLQIMTEKTGPFFGNLSPDQLVQLHNPQLDQSDKTNLAIQIIGRKNIGKRLLSANMKSSKEKLSYWTQPAVAAYLSASLVVVAEIMRLNNENISSETRIDLPRILTPKKYILK